MRIFGGLTDCECACTPTEKSDEENSKTDSTKDFVLEQCCGGELDGCCIEIAKKPSTGRNE